MLLDITYSPDEYELIYVINIDIVRSIFLSDEFVQKDEFTLNKHYKK